MSRYILLLGFIFVASCNNSEPDKAGGNSTPADVSSAMVLSNDEVDRLTAKANQGNVEAAENLSIHFDAIGNPRSAIYWLIKASSSGNCRLIEILKERAKWDRKNFSEQDLVNTDDVLKNHGCNNL